MAKKLGAPIALGVVTVLAILLITGSDSDDEMLKSTFSINAVYFSSTENNEDGYIQINFKDKSEKTNAVILEVLGMEESFQKTILTSEFEEIISFPTPPKYGWEIHPVTLLIDHEDLGKVSIKTEIRPSGEPAAPIIYGKP
ncbi:MAG: hypothetical protein ACE5RQ_06895 [Nitrosopumilus sp.]|jgi:spore coat polysaccharide biosynthesis predicted glycosyltransferase SpsG|nr:hypothetical protein [Nitrosopumilaceae archaeon]